MYPYGYPVAQPPLGTFHQPLPSGFSPQPFPQHFCIPGAFAGAPFAPQWFPPPAAGLAYAPFGAVYAPHPFPAAFPTHVPTQPGAAPPGSPPSYAAATAALSAEQWTRFTGADVDPLPSAPPPPTPIAESILDASSASAAGSGPPVGLPFAAAPEEFPTSMRIDDQRRCTSCSKFYRESQNADGACRYHPGRYEALFQWKSVGGVYNSWTCCKAAERDDVGCKSQRHVECKATTANMARYDSLLLQAATHNGQQQQVAPSAAESRRQHQSLYPDLLDAPVDASVSPPRRAPTAASVASRSVDEDLLLDLDFGEGVASPAVPLAALSTRPIAIPASSSLVVKGSSGARLQQSPFDERSSCIRHTVRATDTLPGLALKYGVTVDEIRRLNKMNSDDSVWTRHELLIPYIGQRLTEPDDKERAEAAAAEQKRLQLRFRRTVNCNAAEARYYLEGTDYDFEAALAEHKVDVAFERQHPVRRVVKA